MTQLGSTPRAALDRMIAGAGAGRSQLADIVDEIGPVQVTDIVIAELGHRTELRGCVPADTSLLFEHRGKIFGVLARAGATGEFEATRLADPTAADPDVTVEQSLSEVVASLFGPRGTAAAATRSIKWRDTDAVFGVSLPIFETVRRILDSIDRPYALGLGELCVAHGSDKWGLHQYTQHYESHFEAIRDRPLTVLEIGVGGYSDPRRGGESLRMWRDYFCRATVFGVDIVDKTALSGQRMTVLRGDQSVPADLAEIVRTTGLLDIIIDDGSHLGSHIITSFRALFPALRDGGWYVIEDLQTSYWPSFAEHSGDHTKSPTAIDFVKTLIDGLNYAEADNRTDRDTDAQIKGLHFYHNMVFIEKGANRGAGAPQWVRNA
ncbi:class I SAM-dependent methyltransferase [Nocardia jinanensis]|nr:class I SAM-dependent methyltransferase [Nocardia jinanensis]